MSPEQADQTLKALCYLHHYAPATGSEVAGNELEQLHYPRATLHLRDQKYRIRWNTYGHEFIKARPEYGDGEAGRSYYFLKTVFSNKERWKQLSRPTSEDLAPYRDLLSVSMPYFFAHASDIIQLFGRDGALPEKEAMLEWAAREKAATNPKMNCKTCCSDFHTAQKVEVIGFTQLELKQTLAEIKMIEGRLAKEGENRRGDPAGAGQPAIKPADKVPAEVQPSTPRSKDGPR